MSSEFASGRYAFGFCDRCGFRYDLNELKAEFEDKKPNPQLQLGRFRVFDPQTLRDPRPDNSKIESQSLFGWKPVGDNVSLELTGSVGSVTIVT